MDSLQVKQPAESWKTHLMMMTIENKDSLALNLSAEKNNDKPEQFISAPEHQLKKLEKHQVNLISSPGSLGAKHEKARLVSNKTHYSPTDPDARISVKPGKARKLNYRCSLAADTAEGVISQVQADFADSRDSQFLPHLVMLVQDRLKENQLQMRDLLADAGYANGSNYAFLEQQGITGWIPVFGRYKPAVENFPYNKELDQYTCPMGKPLPFKGFDQTQDGRLLKNYWAAPKDCKACTLKPTCVPTSQCKKIIRTAYDPEYLRAYARQQSRQGRCMRRLRQGTVEPIFGSLIHYYGLRKIGVRGKAGAHKVMLMAATAFNLKKYMKFKPREVVSQAIALQKEPDITFAYHCAAFTTLFSN
jgi:hypothetical protein